MDMMPMKRFYTRRWHPSRDGEKVLIDGQVFVARLKTCDNEKCGKCYFSTENGCGMDVEGLGCFDISSGKRYYYIKEERDGEEVVRSEEVEGVQGV